MLCWAVVVGNCEQALPSNAILAGPILSFLGGDCVFNSITYSLAAGMTDDYVLRASYFGYMSSISYVVALLGPALASASMSLLLWLPFWIGIILLLIAAPVVALLPEHTSSAPSHSRNSDEQSQPLLSSPLLKARESTPSLSRSVIDRFHTLASAITSHSRNFSLMLICFFLASLASSDTKLLVQYISKRYQWTFASAGYLLSGKAIINFTLLTVVVPRLLQSATASAQESSDKTNMRFANMCFAVSVIGALAIALSSSVWHLVPALAMYAMGSALPIFTLSLLKSPSVVSSPPPLSLDGNLGGPSTSLAEGDVETHIFSIVMLVKIMGSLLGAPLMAFLWVRGIGIGGAALGMPYFVSSACYVVAVVVFSRIVVE